MSVALSTTKRKFHKILDSISNASSTTLASPPEDLRTNNASTTSLGGLNQTAERPVKKPRRPAASSAFVQSSPALYAQLSHSSGFRDRIKTSKNKPGSMGGEERNLPNFAPWDRGQFLNRLKTFRHVEKWMGKPDSINEVQWAKRGWSCVGKERVKCVGGCGKEIFINLEDEENVDEEPRDEASGEDDGQDWRDDAQEELVKKYAELIASGHDGGCLWKRRGCDDTIQRLPLAHQNTALTSLRLRYESLAAMSTELPSNISTPSSFNSINISNRASPFLLSPSPPSDIPPTTSPTPSTQAPPIDTSALTLAAFGWQAEPSTISGLASCAACFRRLGLWLFKPTTTSPPSSPRSPSSPSSSSSPPPMARLDVVAEHREYCPWINATSQGGNGSTTTTTSKQISSIANLAGWELLLRAINNTAQQSRWDDVAAVASDERRAPDTRAVDDVFSATKETKETPPSSSPPPPNLGIEPLSPEDAQAKELAARDEKDKERWAKLKRLKSVFHVKRGKGKLGGGGASDQRKVVAKS